MISAINQGHQPIDVAAHSVHKAPVRPQSSPALKDLDHQIKELKRTEDRLRIQHQAHGDALPGSEVRFHYTYGPDGHRYVVDVSKEESRIAQNKQTKAPQVSDARPPEDLGTVKEAYVQALRAKLADAESRLQSADSDYDHLTEEQIAELRRIDADVRAHEAAHARVGGSLAGPPRYQYELGPDGKMYAVGGEVNISIPRGRNPEETIRIMSTVKAAATAVSDMSPADARVASYAARRIHQAMQEMRKMQQEEMEKKQVESRPVFMDKKSVK